VVDRKQMKLDITYTYGKNEVLRFTGFEPLGVDDMRLLQGVIAMSGPHGVEVDILDPKTSVGKQLVLVFEPDGEMEKQRALAVKTSLYKLLKEIGYSDHDSHQRKSFMESLIRLSNVTIHVQNGSRFWSCHMLSYAIDQNDGRVWIGVNPRVAEAVLGRRPYARIEMSEVRLLKSEPARLMHQRLCGYIDPGKMHPVSIGLEVLCGYIWPEPTGNDRAARQRRTTARKALAELSAVGWMVEACR
jgi:hypothetical protein